VLREILTCPTFVCHAERLSCIFSDVVNTFIVSNCNFSNNLVKYRVTVVL